MRIGQEIEEPSEFDEPAPPPRRLAPSGKRLGPKAKPSKMKVAKGPGGCVLAAITKQLPGGLVQTWAVAMSPGEIDDVRRRVEEWAAKTNAKVAAWAAMGGQVRSPEMSDAPLPPTFLSPLASHLSPDPDAPLPITFAAKSTLPKRMSLADFQAKMIRLVQNPAYKPTEAEFDSMTVQALKLAGPQTANALQDRKLAAHPSSTRLSFKGLKKVQGPSPKFQTDPFEPVSSEAVKAIASLDKKKGRPTVQGKWLDNSSPGWSVMGVSFKDRAGQDRRAVAHCIQLPSGKIVPAKVVPCPTAEKAAGMLDGGPHVITEKEKSAVFGHHVRASLIGKLKQKVAASCGVGDAINQLDTAFSVPGDWAHESRDLHKAKFVDDALHEEQIALFADAGPRGMDMYRRDTVFGDAKIDGSAMPGVILPEIAGITPRIMRGEIIDPSEVIDRSPDADVEDRLFRHREKQPKLRAVETYDYSGPSALVPPSVPEKVKISGRFEIGYQHPTEIGASKKKVVRSYVPSRDRKKLALWSRTRRELVYRHAMNAAWKRGSKNPTKREVAIANLWTDKLLTKHGAPTSLSGDTVYGCAVVTPAHLGLDLYSLNPFSWFRSKEVNALHRAQIEAAERRKKAEKLKPLTEETRRRWEEVKAIEDELSKNIQAIETAKAASGTKTALVGAWWWPYSKHRQVRALVMKEADIIAPHPSKLPPLPSTADQMPPATRAMLDPGPSPEEGEPPVEETEAQEMQESAEAESDPESAEAIDGLLGCMGAAEDDQRVMAALRQWHGAEHSKIRAPDKW